MSYSTIWKMWSMQVSRVTYRFSKLSLELHNLRLFLKERPRDRSQFIRHASQTPTKLSKRYFFSPIRLASLFTQRRFYVLCSIWPSSIRHRTYGSHHLPSTMRELSIIHWVTCLFPSQSKGVFQAIQNISQFPFRSPFFIRSPSCFFIALVISSCMAASFVQSFKVFTTTYVVTSTNIGSIAEDISSSVSNSNLNITNTVLNVKNELKLNLELHLHIYR